MIVNCNNCGYEINVTEYEYKIGKGKYCSKKCYWASRVGVSKKKKTSLCQICNKEFTRFLSRFYEGRGKYCSSKCKYIAYSQKHSFTRNCKLCGNEFHPSSDNINKGYGNYCSRKCFGITHSGKNAPNWRGGITPINKKIRNSVEYQLWRKAVFLRDNFTCVFCGTRGGKIQADHIKPFSWFPELRFAIDNGRTLCVDCHKKTPTYAGNSKVCCNQ